MTVRSAPRPSSGSNAFQRRHRLTAISTSSARITSRAHRLIGPQCAAVLPDLEPQGAALDAAPVTVRPGRHRHRSSDEPRIGLHARDRTNGPSRRPCPRGGRAAGSVQRLSALSTATPPGDEALEDLRLGPRHAASRRRRSSRRAPPPRWSPRRRAAATMLGQRRDLVRVVHADLEHRALPSPPASAPGSAARRCGC